MLWSTVRIPIRVAVRRTLCVLPLLLTAACRDTPRSAAADVSYADVRKLPPGRNERSLDLMMLEADHGRVLGADSARVQLFVVSDYQCAGCRAWFETTLPTIRAEYIEPGTVRLAWVHYPLREHPDAVRAASAALCAAAQGKFWETSARIFAAQERWGGSRDVKVLLDSLASVPGIDAFALRNCTESDRMLRQIRTDIAWADTARVGAPLTVVVGARRIPGTAPLSTLRAAIDSAVSGK
ncbi:MAG: thioredoxin domain-containing protein [Gemmatimonadaceae bacterium]|nr:thioredoxin domain-containing protein [Gemmatimonadaceae bacterium]